MRGSRRLLIVAGEASGDQHGAGLMREAQALDPSIRFIGIGGKHMRAAGLEAVFDAESIAVVGLMEVIRHLPRLRKAFAACLAQLSGVDGVVLVDYPGFNLRLATKAREAGKPVLYFISPQVWAWKPGRITQIARDVDKMLVVFPFEVDLYKDRDIDVEYVGHPLLDVKRPEKSREECASALGLNPDAPVLGVLPGSRLSEIRRNLNPALGAARQVKRFFRDIQILMPLASTLEPPQLESMLQPFKDLNVMLKPGPLNQSMPACTAAIVASGTATLETALLEVPMVVIYKVHPLTAALARRLAVTDTFGLVNIVAGERIVPECIQERCNPETISKEVEGYLADPKLRETTIVALRKLREKLGEPGAYGRAAASMATFLNRRLQGDSR